MFSKCTCYSVAFDTVGSIGGVAEFFFEKGIFIKWVTLFWSVLQQGKIFDLTVNIRCCDSG